MAQEKGYRTKTRLAFEEAYNDLPEVVQGYLVPINSNGVKGSRNQNPSNTITGSRDATEPDEGYLDVAGSVVVPVDAHAFGLYLKAMFGAPTSTVVAAKALDNAAVTNRGSGKVGIPCTGHGLAKGAPVVIDGTSNYDGAYILQPETTANELVVLATYAAETVSSSDTCTLARQVTLSAGAVRNVASGLVGLPATAHGLPVGAEITVDGTTAYDGTYTVERGTSANEIIIAHAYVSETLAGDETAVARFHDHVFKITDSVMPSFALEKAFPTVSAYMRAGGCKVGQCSMSLGGDGELTASLSVKGASEDKAAAVLDATPVEFPFHRFKQFQAAFLVDGAAITGRVQTMDLTMNMNLDDDTFTIDGTETTPGDGVRGDLNEGVTALSGSFTALFKDTAYLDKALLSESTAFKAKLINGGYALSFLFEEAKLARTSPEISGPKGVKETYSWTAFYSTGAQGSSVVATLRNEIKDWEV